TNPYQWLYDLFSIFPENQQGQYLEPNNMITSSQFLERIQPSSENNQEQYPVNNHTTSFQSPDKELYQKLIITSSSFQFPLENHQEQNQEVDRIAKLTFLLNEKELSNAFLVFLWKLLGDNLFLYYNKFLESFQNSSSFPEMDQKGERKKNACNNCRSRKKKCVGGKIGEESCKYCSKNNKICSYVEMSSISKYF
ncbi:20161_t:CDS:2, partial [Cetraspora pellucida]